MAVYDAGHDRELQLGQVLCDVAEYRNAGDRRAEPNVMEPACNLLTGASAIGSVHWRRRASVQAPSKLLHPSRDVVYEVNRCLLKSLGSIVMIEYALKEIHEGCLVVQAEVQPHARSARPRFGPCHRLLRRVHKSR